MAINSTIHVKDAGNLIMSGPYLLWLERDIFPYMFGSMSLLTIIIGLVLHIGIYKVFSKQEHRAIIKVLIHFTIIDIAADVLVLTPETYLSFSKSHELLYGYCAVNGILSTTVFLIQFGILSCGIVLSSVALRRHQDQKENTYIHVFVVCTIAACFISLILAIIPVVWDNGYVFRSSEYQCGPDRSTKRAYVHTMFSLSVFLLLAIASVNSILIVKLVFQNMQVSNISQTFSEETIIMDDQTRSSFRNQENGTDASRQHARPFKSTVTVTIEDQTKSYSRNNNSSGQCVSNRFESGVTISMEDHTKTYEKNPFKVSTEINTTVSMEDHTPSNSKSEITSASASESDSELEELYQSRTIGGHRIFEEISSAELHSPDELSTERHNRAKIQNVQPNPFIINEASWDSSSSHSSIPPFIKTRSTDSADGSVNRAEETSFKGSRGTGSESRASPKPSSRGSRKRQRQARNIMRTHPTSGRKTVLSEVIMSTILNKNENIKVVATCTIVSWAVIACWSPFVVLVYLDMRGSSLWEGWLTVAMICGNLSYCIKPMIILGVRGQLLKATKAVLPMFVKKKTDHISSVVKKTLDKVGKRLY